MMKSAVFYMVAGTVIALVAQVAGASLPVVILSSFVGPPFLLLVIAIIRYSRIR